MFFRHLVREVLLITWLAQTVHRNSQDKNSYKESPFRIVQSKEVMDIGRQKSHPQEKEKSPLRLPAQKHKKQGQNQLIIKGQIKIWNKGCRDKIGSNDK